MDQISHYGIITKELKKPSLIYIKTKRKQLLVSVINKQNRVNKFKGLIKNHNTNYLGVLLYYLKKLVLSNGGLSMLFKLLAFLMIWVKIKKHKEL